MRPAGLGVAAALVVAGLVTVAVTDDGAADHACDLLTTSEVEDLLGVPTNGPSEDTDRSFGTYCEWVSTDSDDGGDASDVGDGGIEPYFLSVELDEGTEAVQRFESDRPVNSERIDGLGDDAYVERHHGIAARSGDQVFSTYADGNREHPLSTAEREDLARRAAELAVDRL